MCIFSSVGRLKISLHGQGILATWTADGEMGRELPSFALTACHFHVSGAHGSVFEQKE